MVVRGQIRNPEALGRMLQQGRLLHGLSQRQLAEQLGLGQKYVWEMEQGKPGLLTDGARAARALNLSSTDTVLADFDGVPALVIERFDRSDSAPTGRVHQEDMNQALGARGNEKYQELGGKVSLRRIANLLGRNGDAESLERLLALMVLAVAVGNLDMHAKNISLLHLPDGSSTLAPAYDVVPMRHLNTDGRMALAVNGVYQHADLTRADLVAEAASWRMRDPEPVIARTLEALEAFTSDREPDPRAHPDLRCNVRRYTRRLLTGEPIGA